MSHYRDQRDPEAVHFPARLGVLALYGLSLFVLLVVLALVLLVDHFDSRSLDLIAIPVAVAILVRLWPKHIVTDVQGIHIEGNLFTRKRMIRWKEIHTLHTTREISSFPRQGLGFLSNQVIEIVGPPRTQPIRFTSRHSGRDAFLHQLRMHGAPGLDHLLPAPPKTSSHPADHPVVTHARNRTS